MECRLRQVRKVQEEDDPKTLQEEMRHLERMVGPSGTRPHLYRQVALCGSKRRGFWLRGHSEVERRQLPDCRPFGNVPRVQTVWQMAFFKNTYPPLRQSKTHFLFSHLEIRQSISNESVAG